MSTLTPAPSVARTSGAGCGRVATRSPEPAGPPPHPPAPGRPALPDGRSRGDSRCKPDRYAHWFSCGSKVSAEEDGRALLPRAPLQRRGDQIADAARRGERVLGGEQPVVAGQIHTAAQRNGLPQQPDPSVRAVAAGTAPLKNITMRPDPRPRHLQRRRHADRPSRLQIRQRIEHGRRAVEVRSQPTAHVPLEKRIEPDVHLAREMRCNNVIGQGQIGPVRTLPPAANDRRRPPRPAQACVLPPSRVHIPPGREQRTEESDLVPRRRRRRDRTRPLEKKPRGSPPVDVPAAASSSAAGATAHSPPAGGPTPPQAPAFGQSAPR